MATSIIDLHCHSLASDGALSPQDLVTRAHERGVKVLALTDHDTTAGLAQARLQADSVGMKLVTGIEFSTQWRAYGIHILGLHFDEEHPAMKSAVARQQQARVTRSEQIAARLQKKGLPDLLADAVRCSESGVPGRPHFAQAMVEAGLVKDFQEAFKKYLGAGKAGDVKAGWPSVGEAVEWIREAGGLAVIAHPRKYDMTLTKLRALIEEFMAAGGQGIEVSVSGQKQGEIGLLVDLCRRSGLLASSGSDFHSPRFAWADLGSQARLPSDVPTVWDDWTDVQSYLSELHGGTDCVSESVPERQSESA